MDIKRILVAGDLAHHIKNLIDIDTYKQAFRFLEEEQVTDDDLQWANAYVAFKPTVNFNFHNIKWVHSFGAGVDRFLFNREWNQEVLLTRTVCSFGQRISQYSLSYYLRDLQQHDFFKNNQAKKEWQPVTPDLIDGQKVVVYGTGEIGQEVAKMFAAFGMKVCGVSLSGKKKATFHDVYPVSEQQDVLSGTDLVINTLPLTEKTNGLFDEEVFEALTNAMFINVGRGASVVESALLKALEGENLRLAVLDVFKEEPLPEASRLWEQKNVIITPHISAVTTAEEAAECFVETLEKLENNEVLTNKVDTVKGY
ncbi:2-hydroxyacid dehydrogenase [Paraliobacillus quinghaiensis]|uniref:2-hydroxyacid dehydrogenase n=1 Tax=Paraliobacillus quinghaiensis TaxID=470815 RepID=A0A917WPD9_9BACI|nr:D-2-hydroxyacid dehydrogenase [Paraliobacillus quinghaiensis]GGM18450.1 2-hydroxyacid dehydrogenase [Paraliobacillus quinghaiensis]